MCLKYGLIMIKSRLKLMLYCTLINDDLICLSEAFSCGRADARESKYYLRNNVLSGMHAVLEGVHLQAVLEGVHVLVDAASRQLQSHNEGVY